MDTTKVKLAERRIRDAALNNATYLNLSELGLTEIPSSIFTLEQLEHLVIDNNDIQILPPHIERLQSLRVLSINNNKLKRITISSFKMLSLRELYLNGNKIEISDADIFYLYSLEVLTLANNGISNISNLTGRLKNIISLDISANRISRLPESIGDLTKLEKIYLSDNRFDTLPESFGNLSNICALDLSGNNINNLPKKIDNIRALRKLNLSGNNINFIPTIVGQIVWLEELDLSNNRISIFPEFIKNLSNLRILNLDNNNISEVPSFISKMDVLSICTLSNNSLSPEYLAAYKGGLSDLKRYLRYSNDSKQHLRESKLVLVGEGGVGKTSLLGALKGDPWIEKRPTTHGVEVDLTSFSIKCSGVKELTFNAWDFGGQAIYRHTHQIFFTSPAVYLAVWDPRRGPEQCCVNEWIAMIKHRAYEESRHSDRPRVLIVATHGGPHERIAHIDEQALLDEFGDLITGFYHVDSKTGYGIEALKNVIADVAHKIPSFDREVPTKWKAVLEGLRRLSNDSAYISYRDYEDFCKELEIEKEEAELYIGILNELGHLIHYWQDGLLKDVVILKPEWLSKAISFILEDEKVKKNNGLLTHDRLEEIWNNSCRNINERYPSRMHPVFLKLMERFDLSYRVSTPVNEIETTLIAQLVPSGRPVDWRNDWPFRIPIKRDREMVRVCRIVDASTGRSVYVEGLLYRLIVRWHRFSLGKTDYSKSVHWKTGVIIEDAPFGRALIEVVGGDIRITVRAAYPGGMLFNLCNDIKYLVEDFWLGLMCLVSVPCVPPCQGLFELQELIEYKREGIDRIRCSLDRKFHHIDVLISSVNEKIHHPQASYAELANQLNVIQKAQEDGFNSLKSDIRKIIALSDEKFRKMMIALNDAGKEGPRLFSVESRDESFFEKPNWISTKLKIILWCEHSRLPLPVISGENDKGVYNIEISRKWLIKAAPLMKALATTLRLTLPMASSTAQMLTDEIEYKRIESQLSFGTDLGRVIPSTISNLISFGHAGRIIDPTNADEDEDIWAFYAKDSTLAELHHILKQKDPYGEYGGLVRVQNKLGEYLWVYKNYVSEY